MNGPLLFDRLHQRLQRSFQVGEDHEHDYFPRPLVYVLAVRLKMKNVDECGSKAVLNAIRALADVTW